MKKGIIVLLIAVLASSFAFAKLTGDAGVRFDAYLGEDGAAFITSNAKSLDFTFTFASDDVAIDGDEGTLHVEVAASAKFLLGKLKNSVTADPTNGILIANGDRGIGAVIKLDTAKIVGKNWYVSVLGTQDAYDYAKAAVLQRTNKKVKDDFTNVYDYEDQAASYKADYNKVPGVTVGVNGFTASAGFDYVELKNAEDIKLFAASGSIETPEFAFSDDAVKVQAAAEFSRYGISEGKAAIKGNTIGASAKATVAIQDITVGVAADMGLEYLGAEIEGQPQRDTEFNIDARVDFKYNFVDVNLYTYAGKAGLGFGDAGSKYQDFYLEAKAVFDLNVFDLPIKVTASAKNITNAEVLKKTLPPITVKGGIDPSLKVEYAKDAINAAVSFGLNTESKDWNVLAYGTYAFEKLTVGAGVKVAKDDADDLNVISFGAFAESDKIVKGATFGLSYGLSNDDCYSDGCAATLADGNFNSNFKDDPVSAGAMLAYCKIAF